VVSTDVLGLPYLLQHEHNALLVPCNDAAAMAKAVGRVLHEDNLAAELSQCGRQEAELHDWQSVLPQWKELLSDCIRARTNFSVLRRFENLGS
jgi:glycosyltransferase involved in cell wall biosynthesis